MYNFASTAGGGAMALPYRVARNGVPAEQADLIASPMKKPANQK